MRVCMEKLREMMPLMPFWSYRLYGLYGHSGISGIIFWAFLHCGLMVYVLL